MFAVLLLILAPLEVAVAEPVLFLLAPDKKRFFKEPYDSVLVLLLSCCWEDQFVVVIVVVLG